VLDGTLPVNKLQKQMRDIVASKIDLKRFARARRNRSDHARPGKRQDARGGNYSRSSRAAAPEGARSNGETTSQYFFGEPLVGFDPSEITGAWWLSREWTVPGARRRLPAAEWLESEGFAVQTSGLRRSNLVGRDIDELLAKNAVTRLTLALMYATDFSIRWSIASCRPCVPGRWSLRIASYSR